MEEENPDAGGDDDSSIDSGDDETVITTTGMGDTMFDIENLEDEEEEELPESHMQVSSMYGDARSRRRGKARVHLGPPQKSDVDGRKVPSQVTLKKIEHLFHKLSCKVAYELVAAPPLESGEGGANSSSVQKERESKENEDLDEDEKVAAAALKRKYPMDEFDRLLALEFKSANPVNRILASFLGPLMRMGRTVIYVIRIAFNATTWRDPFLSFWIFASFLALLMLLLVFPWRAFFFFVTVVGLGPQNILLRKYLERQAERRETDKREASSAPGDNVSENASDRGVLGSNLSTNSGETFQKKNGLFGIGLAARRPARRGGKRPSIDNMEVMVGERPAFSSDFYGQSSSKKLSPRSIAIPYSRVRKERFYDWPPDPTVSRATPLELFAPPSIDTDIGEMAISSEVPQPPSSASPVEHPPQHARQRTRTPSPPPREQTLRHRKPFNDQTEPELDKTYMDEYEKMGYG